MFVKVKVEPDTWKGMTGSLTCERGHTEHVRKDIQYMSCYGAERGIKEMCGMDDQSLILRLR